MKQLALYNFYRKLRGKMYLILEQPLAAEWFICPQGISFSTVCSAEKTPYCSFIDSTFFTKAKQRLSASCWPGITRKFKMEKLHFYSLVFFASYLPCLSSFLRLDFWKAAMFSQLWIEDSGPSTLNTLRLPLSWSSASSLLLLLLS